MTFGDTGNGSAVHLFWWSKYVIYLSERLIGCKNKLKPIKTIKSARTNEDLGKWSCSHTLIHTYSWSGSSLGHLQIVWHLRHSWENNLHTHFSIVLSKGKQNTTLFFPNSHLDTCLNEEYAEGTCKYKHASWWHRATLFHFYFCVEWNAKQRPFFHFSFLTNRAPLSNVTMDFPLRFLASDHAYRCTVAISVFFQYHHLISVILCYVTTKNLQG